MRKGIIAFSFLICSAAQAQIQNLVFEGAGIRGIAYAGAIKELEAQNLIPQIKKVGGTSAGAITALLIALNYNAAEIEAIIGSTNFKRFNDGRFFFAGGINRLNKYFGWYRGNRLESWLEKIIEAKTGNANITFIQLKNKGFKDLYVTGTNLNQQKLVVFSHQSYPNCKVKDAVRVSVSIPLYFEPLYTDTSGNIIKRPKSKSNVNILLDGGFIANYPIRLFDDAASETKFNKHTIGFRIDSETQINYDSLQKGLAPIAINNLQQYVGAFYNIVIESLNRQTLTADDWKRTVSISDGNIGPRIRKLKKEEIRELVENGRKATQSYLATHTSF